MSVEEKYNFTDFTLNNYKKILEIALLNYSFVNFLNFNTYEREIILRHDIEFSLPIAKEMAKIEKELGILSTFFVQLHSEFYNPFDKDSFDCIKEIINMGHLLGLHFDTHFWNITKEEEIDKYIIKDKRVLEEYFQVEIKVFSFHNTNAFILSCEEERYGGLINVYSKYFKENFSYATDSTGYWRFERLEDRLKMANDKKLHILIHDGMWQNEILPPRQRVFKVIDDRANFLKDLYDKTLKKFGAKNIDWNGPLE